MRHLAKRLKVLQRRDVAAKPHVIFMPVRLTEAEKAAWEEEHTSPAALAAAGILPDSLIVVVPWYGSKDHTPAGVTAASK